MLGKTLFLSGRCEKILTIENGVAGTVDGAFSTGKTKLFVDMRAVFKNGDGAGGTVFLTKPTADAGGGTLFFRFIPRGAIGALYQNGVGQIM